ncbi:hypothetical protein HY572_04575 [Candidatus Micrarchaeota archaeon]|nr:hypothetical protein [Candidatus Micrarchaeota archaeon]
MSALFSTQNVWVVLTLGLFFGYAGAGDAAASPLLWAPGMLLAATMGIVTGLASLQVGLALFAALALVLGTAKILGMENGAGFFVISVAGFLALAVAA